MSMQTWRLMAGGVLVLMAAAGAFAASATPTKFVQLDQATDQATLHRLHHTDQGTRLVPAAWLAAVNQADGSSRFMDAANLQRMGFIASAAKPDKLNPFGWPVGFTVSDPGASGAVPMAGLTCATCHTGQIQYKGTVVRIEGGQGMQNLTTFFNELSNAFVATAKDPSRRTKFFADAIKAGYPSRRMKGDFEAAVASFADLAESGLRTSVGGPAPGPGRQDAAQGIANKVLGDNLMVPGNRRDRDAPVSIPYVWDIWRLSWVQTNGFMPGDKSLSRNLGEVLGVFGTMNMVDPKTGALNPEPLRWQTSVQYANLIWMEEALRTLHAPTWPEAVLGAVDQTKAAEGRQLFKDNCAGCHGIKELPNGVWDVTVIPLLHIGTDPAMAVNYAARTYDASILGLSKETTVPQALDAATAAVRARLYAENKTPAAEHERDAPLEAPCGYKARPLIGVWATPPFLHNGSVRTVFDLLSDTRPEQFTLGSLEYDPVNLGYTEDQSPAPFVFDTRVAGNSNAGHWWTDDGTRPGRIGPKLADDEKYAIIEFLKSANYDNYPSEKRAKMEAMPCQGMRDWAAKK